MKHKVAGKKLSRTTNERKALFRALLGALFLHGAIKTTRAKAKAVAPQAEKLITLAKKGTLGARRQSAKALTKRQLVNLLFDEVAPRFKTRISGFTRIINLGRRIGDGAEMVRLELVEKSKSQSSSLDKLGMTLSEVEGSNVKSNLKSK